MEHQPQPQPPGVPTPAWRGAGRARGGHQALCAALLLGLGSACGAKAPELPPGVELLHVGPVNIALIDRPNARFIVDSGSRGNEREILARLAARGQSLEHFAGVVLTHAHNDHAGSAASLQSRGLPVWIHEDDAVALTEGVDRPAEVIGPEAAMVNLLVAHDFAPVAADVIFTDALPILDSGVIMERVGGHTPGSIALVIDEEIALVGDLIRGGYLGGAIAGSQPMVHYFHEDKAVAHQALRELLQRHPDVKTIWPAHGGPLSRADVEAFLEKLASAR